MIMVVNFKLRLSNSPVTSGLVFPEPELTVGGWAILELIAVTNPGEDAAITVRGGAHLVSGQEPSHLEV
jgi:hypothetical protein